MQSTKTKNKSQNSAMGRGSKWVNFKEWLWDSKTTIIFTLAFLAFWELGVRIFQVPRYIVPSLTSIFMGFGVLKESSQAAP